MRARSVFSGVAFLWAAGRAIPAPGAGSAALAVGRTPQAAPEGGRSVEQPFSFHRELLGEASSLSVRADADPATGRVVVGGVDRRRPSEPFTFDWGDGRAEAGWLPAEHTYQDRARNHPIRVTAHYDDGRTDTAELLARFQPPMIAPVPLPSITAVTIPDRMPPLSTRLYDLPADLTVFDDTFFDTTPRSTVEYVLSVAAGVQYDCVNRNVLLPDGAFRQVVLRNAQFGGMASLWFTTPVSFQCGDYGLAGALEYSSFFHEMGHNFTLNTPSTYHYGGRIDGCANAIYSETMAQIFQHATAWELVNDAEHYGLGEDLAADIRASACASMRIVRASYEDFLASGKRPTFWNRPGTPTDETFNTFMTFAFRFFVHAEEGGEGYIVPLKRMMQLLQTFDEDMHRRWDQAHDTPEAAAFRSTLMVAALSYAFEQDLRPEFRDLNFPIADATYEALQAHAKQGPGG